MLRRHLVGIGLILCTISSAPAVADAAPRTLEIGGALLIGGYLDDSADDWDAGPGGMLFLTLPLGVDFDARLAGSMVWNDGSDQLPRSARASEKAPLDGVADAHRRSALEVDLLYNVESLSIADVGLPYVGIGVGAYEWIDTFSVPAGGLEGMTVERSAWDTGVAAIAGVKFYRTSGLFVGLEGALRVVDTPRETTEAYDIGIVLGYRTGP